MKVFVSTIPFSESSPFPIQILKEAGAEVFINDLGRKISSRELAEKITDIDCLIAGTEKIDKTLLDQAKKLKLISRVGVGLDGIDLEETKRRGIKVTYTPNAPVKAVSELTIGFILQLARNIKLSDIDIKNNIWKKRFGFLISEMTIGIIGTGAVGASVIKILSNLGSPKILANSLEKDDSLSFIENFEWTDNERIFKESDLISFHLPLTKETTNLVTKKELKLMKKNCMLINTSRGGIINESDLYWALENNIIYQAALDVFCEEPYKGPLKNLDNCILTPHIGSLSFLTRSLMEVDAAKEVEAFLSGNPQNHSAPGSY